MAQYSAIEAIQESLAATAKQMLLAARTAPKAKGVDNLFLSIIDGDDIQRLAAKMKEMGTQPGISFFVRDAESILQAQFIVLLGTRIQSAGLKKCGMCGFSDCEEKNKFPNTPCAINTGDLGIAIGSAVSVATDHRVDNRIMFSVGQAAMKLGIIPSEVRIAYGIPLSASNKSPFFDRK